MNEKFQALDEVYEAAEAYREAQAAVARKRETFIDTILSAKKKKATQQEIAERCIIDPHNPQKHLSRQRVAQFINERKPVHTNVKPFAPAL